MVILSLFREFTGTSVLKPMRESAAGGTIVYVVLKPVQKDTEEVTHTMDIRDVSKNVHHQHTQAIKHRVHVLKN